jgi:FAD/FMN-containing dehydrogenase
MAREESASDFAVLEGPQQELVFDALCELPLALRNVSPCCAIFRIATVPSSAPALIRGIQEIADRHSLGCAVLVRALNIIYIAVFGGPEETSCMPLVGGSREIVEFCMQSGAAPVIEFCPPEMKKALNIWPPPGEEQEIAQRIKQVFDPRGILAPGRFRGGI